MEDVRDNLHVDSSDVTDRTLACSLQSHVDCDETCEVTRFHSLASELSAAQIKIGCVAAVAGMSLSFIYGLAILAVWLYCVFTNQHMPPIPWVIGSLVSSTFVAGAITTIKLPGKARIQIGQQHEDE